MKSVLNKAIILPAFLSACFISASWASDWQTAPTGEFPIGPGQAVLMGIESNFQLKAEKLSIPETKEEVTFNDAAFDPSMEVSLSVQDQKIPTGLVFYEKGYNESEKTRASAGVGKLFETGLRSSLTFETYRFEDNFIPDSLDPEYRSLVTLNFTQPIMRDFGVDINTTKVNMAKNRVEMAFMAYTRAARTLAERIERLYYDLSFAEDVLKRRVESMKLAEELLEANRRRFENGMASITPVTEAGTALSDRREKIIQAEQQVEIASNHLKNLLEIGPGHAMFLKRLRTDPMPNPSRSFPVVEKAVKTAMEKRSDLKEMAIAIENQDLLVAWLENQKLPRLDFLASAGLNGLSGDNNPVDLFGTVHSSPHTGDYWESYSNMTEADGYQWAAGLRMVYPIGNRAAISRHVRGKYEKRRLDYLLERLKGEIRTEVMNGSVSVERGYERVQEAETFIRLAKETLDQENQLLEEGLSTTFRILEHQEKLVSAKIRHASALADFHKSMARLYRAMGENLARRGIVLEISDLPALP